MSSARAPLHPWVGQYRCHQCDEPFAYVRGEDGIPEMRDAFAQVAHVHDAEHPDGIWTLMVYRRYPGQRYPTDVRALQLQVIEQKRAARGRAR